MVRIAIFLTEGYDAQELELVRDRLQQAGLEGFFVGEFTGQVLFAKAGHGETKKVDFAFSALEPEACSGAILADGRWCDERLEDDDAQRLLQGLHLTGRPIAAFARGVRLLAATGICGQGPVTSTDSERAMLEGAGARWIDSQVATCGHVLTARGPAAMDRLMRKFVAAVEHFRTLPSGEHARESHAPS